MELLREMSKSRGYEIYKEYQDRASGKNDNRPKFREMMEDARRHKFDGIFAVRLDRVMRSVSHLEVMLQNLRTYNVRLIFSDMEFDPNNPNSQLVMHMLSAIAEWERQIISMRVKEGLNHARNEGKELGRRRRDDIPIHGIALLRVQGKSWNEISKIYGIPRSTISERREQIDAEVEKIQNDVQSH